MDKLRVLIVDDDPAVGRVLCALLSQAGYVAELATGVRAALQVLRAEPVELIITDLRMPDADGFALLTQVKQLWPDLPVVMLTAHGNVPIAVAAMREGASDFMLKPFEREEVISTVRRVLATHATRRIAPPRGPELSSRLIGASAALNELQERITRAAQSSAAVLLRGERGTGKELAARLIHQRSARAEKPLIVADLGSIPESLIESELFGQANGGAEAERRPGRVELAEGGTLLLDDVDALSLAQQVKLLHLTEHKKLEPAGAPARQADVRFMAATHRDLEAMVAEGRFRADLYYRLSVIPIRLPPLREHKEDIRQLTEHFAASFAESHGQRPAQLSPEVWAVLEAHAWPGNVRELSNLTERLVVLRSGETIGASVVREELTHAAGFPRNSASEEPASLDLETRRRETEKTAIATAIQKARGNRTLAARILGVSRRTLYNKLAEHGIAERDPQPS